MRTKHNEYDNLIKELRSMEMCETKWDMLNWHDKAFELFDRAAFAIEELQRQLNVYHRFDRFLWEHGLLCVDESDLTSDNELTESEAE